MPKRSSKRRTPDLNQLATSIVAAATDETPKEIQKGPPSEKNAAAVALGRLGGLKGGKARAKTLSARKRKQIAKKAAAARWSTKDKS